MSFDAYDPPWMDDPFKPYIWNCEVCGKFRSTRRTCDGEHGSPGHEACDRIIDAEDSGLNELHGVIQ